MPSSLRTSLSVLAASAVALQACSRAGPEPQACDTSAECPANARCVSRSCVANAPPAPVVSLPAEALQANLLVAFDASGSDDPDPGDSIAAFSWAFRAIDAPCDAPASASTSQTAVVRFACAGRFAVDLTATDQMSATGTTSVEFDVEPHAGPALVVAGPDLVLDHACTSGPPTCAPAGEVLLTAEVPGSAPDAVSFRWTVEAPPGRPLDASRRVAFEPSAEVASPAVSLETDGTAISGDWVFRVEARDAAGVLGTAATRVSVGNRPPVITASIPVFDHSFDAGVSQFTVAGKIDVQVEDPDGDPLVGRTVTWHHTGDGGAYFGGLDLPDGIGVSITVPYSDPLDAAFLIGGPELERSVSFSIGDVNGETVSEVWPVVVANRPPALAAAPAPVAVDHSFDPASSLYVATATLSTWSDPDGDPLAAAGATSDPECADLAVVGGAAQVSCTMAYAGVPAAGLFASTRSIVHQVGDPFTLAPPAATSLQIRNRAPRLRVTSVGAPGLCHTAAPCCDYDPESHSCFGYPYWADPSSLDVASFVADDDGDPLQVVVSTPRGVVTPAQSVCLPAECAFGFTDPGLPEQCGVPTTMHLGLALRDGGPEVLRQLAYSSCE